MKNNLPNLPDSKDEYWDKHDKQSIELDRLKDNLCELHKLEVHRYSREMNCTKCGFGFRFQPHQIHIEDGKVFIRGGKQISESLTILD